MKEDNKKREKMVGYLNTLLEQKVAPGKIKRSTNKIWLWFLETKNSK